MMSNAVTNYTPYGDYDELAPENFVLQGELIRRQVEHELDGDSNEDLLYVFKADRDVPQQELQQFVDAFDSFGHDVFVYYDAGERLSSEDELREYVENLASGIGLKVVEE